MNITIEDLKPYEKNAKIHSKKQIKKIAASIKRLGFRQPIVINKENVVVMGHGRLEAAKLLKLSEIKLGISQAKKGEKFIPVTVIDDLTEEEIRELRILDNKLNELSEWDNELYDLEVQELSNEVQQILDFKIEQVGGDITEIKGKKINPLHEVVIECENESEQEQVYKELMEQGYNCRLLTM